MRSIGKSFALILILLMALSSLSIFVVKPAFAQSIPKPSVPEFTLKFVDLSYDVPPVTTTTTDQYTGKQVVNTQAGYHVENKSIEVTIKNQPFAYGDNYHLYYDVRMKPHFSENWTELNPTTSLFSGSNLTLAQYISTIYYSYNSLPKSNSTYTNVSLSATAYPQNGQIDFQVAAEIGANSTFYSVHNVGSVIIGGGQYEPAIAYVSSSDWSSTQTVTIPASSSSPLPYSSSTPTSSSVPEFPTLIILPLFAVATLISIVFIKKISKK